MKSSPFTRVFVVSFTILITFVLIITGSLNITSFQKNYTESLVSSYVVSGGESVRKIEYAVKYGKPLENFYGIEDFLSEKKREHPEIENIQVVLPDGRVLYDERGEVEDRRIDERLMDPILQIEGGSFFAYQKLRDKYYVFIPIRGIDQSLIGSLNFVFDEDVVNKRTSIYFKELTQYLILLALVSFGALIAFARKAPFVTESGELRRKLLFAAIVTLLCVVQIVFGVINYNVFQKAYIEMTTENASTTSRLIQKDIASVIVKGIRYDQLHEIEKYLNQIIETNPEIERLMIQHSSGATLYATSSERAKEEPKPEYVTTATLPSDHQKQSVSLSVVLSEQQIKSKLMDIILDMLTVFVTSFLFLVEFTLFTLWIVKRKVQKSARENETVADDADSSQSIRPLVFIFCVAIFMSISFIPVVMNRLYEPIFGLSKSVALGLPISVEMLCAAVATIVAGAIIDKRGWKPAFVTGLVVFSIGTALSSLAWTGLIFIVARGCAGIGYGFGLMALRSFINAIPNEERRTEGLSALFAGMYAGVNCGVIVGAMLADRIGYSQVFLVALGIAGLALLYALFFTKNVATEKTATSATEEQPALERKKLLRFLFNKNVFSFFALLIVPTAICGMFLDYYFPLYAEAEGISASNVGRAFLLNGLCVVYLGPLLSRYAQRYLDVRMAVVVSGLLIVGGMLLFSFHSTVLTAFIVVILLGVSDSFGLVAQNNYYVNLRATGQIGTGKALGFYDNARKLGQMLGPIVFGSVATFGPQGIGVIGGIGFAALIGFFLLSRVETKSQPYQGLDA